MSAITQAKENAELHRSKAKRYEVLVKWLENQNDIPEEVEELLWSLMVSGRGGYYS